MEAARVALESRACERLQRLQSVQVSADQALLRTRPTFQLPLAIQRLCSVSESLSVRQIHRTSLRGEVRCAAFVVFSKTTIDAVRFADVQSVISAAQDVDEPHIDDDAIVNNAVQDSRENRELEALRFASLVPPP